MRLLCVEGQQGSMEIPLLLFRLALSSLSALVSSHLISILYFGVFYATCSFMVSSFTEKHMFAAILMGCQWFVPYTAKEYFTILLFAYLISCGVEDI